MLKLLGKYSFSSTALQAINLKQIEQISFSAFSSCKDLKSVQLGTYLKKLTKGHLACTPCYQELI